MSALASLHTFGLSAQARKIIPIRTLNDVQHIIAATQPFFILGEGSNTVFTEDFAGTVFLNQLLGKTLSETDEDYVLRVASGENWHALVQWCLARGIGGFENLALIPGTVGAAPIQNIGAYGVEIKQFVDCVDYIDLTTGEHISISGDACEFGYRDSIFKHALKERAFITAVHFRLPKDYALVTSYGELKDLATPSMHDVFDCVVGIRSAKLPDPKQVGNAGSFFKNPVIAVEHYHALKAAYADLPAYPVNTDSVKVPAAWLIDQLGFKGKRHGGVQCHPRQALVLTNAAQATGEELITFAQTIQAKVRETFGIAIENEVCLVGKCGLRELNDAKES
ncbi:MAG: UDP-N-acetylmuramate dehydrogenase [Glaciecola sp.]